MYLKSIKKMNFMDFLSVETNILRNTSNVLEIVLIILDEEKNGYVARDQLPYAL